jgi:hypothetical protein
MRFLRCCSFCSASSEGIDPKVYFPYGLPEDLVHVTPESPQELQDEFVEGFAASFCGTNEQAPEPALSWAYMSPGMNDVDHTKPLSKEVTESKDFSERVVFFRYLMHLCFVHAGRHGGCFALKESGKLVAFTITFPPNKRGIYKMGFCEMMHVVVQLGGFQKMPKAVKKVLITEGEPGVRMDVIDKAMGLSHKTHCPNEVPHIYIWCFGVKPGCQGNGYGRKLITYMGECADRMKVPTYLECNGTKNERFYGNNGYKVEERYPLVYTDKKGGEKTEHSFQPDGLPGMSACVRPSR